MLPNFSPIPGAQGYQQSNPSVLATVSLLGSLQTFREAGMMQPLRKRSIKLTGMLEVLLKQSHFFVPSEAVRSKYPVNCEGHSDSEEVGFTIITPNDPGSRGAMLSLLVLPPTRTMIMEKVFDTLMSYGVVGDKRAPNVIRLTPAPLYNTVEDCQRAAMYLEKAFELLQSKE
jgi:kynureninase